MIISLRRWIARAKFILLFILFTVLLNQLFIWAAEWLHPVQRYKEPIGRAIKVMDQQQRLGDNESLQDRMIYFYWYGE